MSQLTTYPQLVRLIEEEFRRGIFEARRQLERQRIRTYWRVGRFMDRHIRGHKLSEDGQHDFFSRLAGDTRREIYFLKQIRVFFQAYPSVPDQDGVSWSHYRELALIPTKAQRLKWERRIVKERIPCQDFYDMLHKRIQAPAPVPMPVEPGARLICRRGRLYTYKVISPAEIPWSTDSVVVDLGFGIRREIAAKTTASLGAGQKVVSYKRGKVYTIKRAEVRAEELYTYRAFVERVIDGDTLIVNIDCGFDCWSHQRLRLLGVNTPELSNKGGVPAQRFVRRTLKPCPWIIVKTCLDKQGKYGRYLADVFFLAGGTADGTADARRVAAEGTHLNQLLLDSGHAEMYKSG